MFMSQKKRVVAGLLAAGLGASVMASPNASADPQQFSAFVGVGSDTTQDVLNGLAGFSNGIQFTPIASTASANPSVQGSFQLVSFDALKPDYVSDNCITTKIGGPSFYRPNGSGAGRKALNASSGLGGGWTGAGGCGTLTDISGQVDFARSSSISSTTGTDEVFIPFGRDAVSFAAYKPGGGAVTTLTKAQLQAIYQSTTASRQVIGGVTMIPCGIQTSSGTFSFWNSALGVAATENAATDQCNLAGTAARIQENDGPALIAKATALDVTLDNFQVIVGFSAAAFTSKSNGLALPAPGAISLGSISDNGSGTNLGSPVSGTAPNITPNATFYNDATFGRYVYNVLPVSVATGPGNAAMKNLFVGSTSKVCQATATINSFGFLSAGTECGTTTRQRAWESGAA